MAGRTSAEQPGSRQLGGLVAARFIDTPARLIASAMDTRRLSSSSSYKGEDRRGRRRFPRRGGDAPRTNGGRHLAHVPRCK